MHLTAASLLAAAGLLVLPMRGFGKPSEPEPPVMVVDLHVDLPWQVHFKGRADDLHEGAVTNAGLKAGAYIGLVLPIYLPDYLHKDGAHIEDAEAVFHTIESVVAKNPLFLPLLSRKAEEGRVSTFLAIEGAGAFAADITQIDRFIERGVRLISPNHSKNSPLSSSATGERVDYGLTPLGKDFCNRVYDKCALIDVSHVSDAAFTDIAAIAERHGAPIVATHSNARALANNPRDLTDDQLRAIGRSGGVAGLNLHTPFLTKEPEAGMADVIKQVDYMVKIAGIDHVALGTDFDGGITPPKGLDNSGTLQTLATALKRHGMSHDDVLKIFSLNALRVLAWRPAGKTGAAQQAGAAPAQ